MPPRARQRDLPDGVLGLARQRAENGDANAQFVLAVMHLNGEHGAERDVARAVEWARRSAAQGYPMAHNMLGHRYRNGEGVPKDDAQAAHHFRTAAEGGHAGAMYNWALYLLTGIGTAHDGLEGSRWMKKAVDAGDTNAKAQFAQFTDLGWDERSPLPGSSRPWVRDPLSGAFKPDPAERALQHSCSGFSTVIWEPGHKVYLLGLKSEAGRRHNGRCGRVLTPLTDGRHTVRLEPTASADAGAGAGAGAEAARPDELRVRPGHIFPVDSFELLEACLDEEPALVADVRAMLRAWASAPSAAELSADAETPLRMLALNCALDGSTRLRALMDAEACAPLVREIARADVATRAPNFAFTCLQNLHAFGVDMSVVNEALRRRRRAAGGAEAASAEDAAQHTLLPPGVTALKKEEHEQAHVRLRALLDALGGEYVGAVVGVLRAPCFGKLSGSRGGGGGFGGGGGGGSGEDKRPADLSALAAGCSWKCALEQLSNASSLSPRVLWRSGVFAATLDLLDAEPAELELAPPLRAVRTSGRAADRRTLGLELERTRETAARLLVSLVANEQTARAKYVAAGTGLSAEAMLARVQRAQPRAPPDVRASLQTVALALQAAGAGSEQHKPSASGPAPPSAQPTTGGSAADAPARGSFSRVGTSCRHCGAYEPADRPHKRCARCGVPAYCSRECQAADWAAHRADCKRDSAHRASRKAGQQLIEAQKGVLGAFVQSSYLWLLGRALLDGIALSDMLIDVDFDRVGDDGVPPRCEVLSERDLDNLIARYHGLGHRLDAAQFARTRARKRAEEPHTAVHILYVCMQGGESLAGYQSLLFGMPVVEVLMPLLLRVVGSGEITSMADARQALSAAKMGGELMQHPAIVEFQARVAEAQAATRPVDMSAVLREVPRGQFEQVLREMRVNQDSA